MDFINHLLIITKLFCKINDKSASQSNKIKLKQKKKKKRSTDDCNHCGSSSAADGIVGESSFGDAHPNISIEDLNVPMDDINLEQKPAKTIEEALHKPYQFWCTQPVPKIDERVISNEPIVSPELLNVEPSDLAEISLPNELKWDTLNLNEPLVLKELYALLNGNYVEDNDCMFRFNYQMDFLKWVLHPPGFRQDLLLGMRKFKSGRLVAFISSVPVRLRIYDQVQTAVEMNFFCVHKKLRSKRLAPFLMREMYRRVKLSQIYLAVYTAGIVLPKPIGTCSYWLRTLNPKKLIDVKFTQLPRNMTMKKTLTLYKLPDLPKISGFRKLEPQDCEKAFTLLKHYLCKFDLTPVFNEDDFKHWFTPQPDIIDSFVVEATNGSITDFVSYYTLPFTMVAQHPVYDKIKAAYAFYNVSTKTPWVDLMHDALVTAKNSGFDIFYALDLMDNKEFLEPLKFRLGNGNLQYYLYNWRCPSMTPNKIGLVLH
ncbi:glycylpeptide N-tetradecanoyltransferase-like [Cydia pomonella]|uniref:glycylpeptide N-tetradecanoyltransferase-like n=1 Tax=Cydia pomonella TaxID=82600 RepID=UPI002ADD9450|nr:glycylpeptide N-tetradecanoyltransferase-like [Cydia pomonella]